jgi:hypothetical protein
MRPETVGPVAAVVEVSSRRHTVGWAAGREAVQPLEDDAFTLFPNLPGAGSIHHGRLNPCCSNASAASCRHLTDQHQQCSRLFICISCVPFASLKTHWVEALRGTPASFDRFQTLEFAN